MWKDDITFMKVGDVMQPEVHDELKTNTHDDFRARLEKNKQDEYNVSITGSAVATDEML